MISYSDGYSNKRSGLTARRIDHGYRLTGGWHGTFWWPLVGLQRGLNSCEEVEGVERREIWIGCARTMFEIVVRWWFLVLVVLLLLLLLLFLLLLLLLMLWSECKCRPRGCGGHSLFFKLCRGCLFLPSNREVCSAFDLAGQVGEPGDGSYYPPAYAL